jgi:hypothetical protein
MDTYIYQAAMLCTPCTTEIRNAIEGQNMIAGRDITQRWRSTDGSKASGPRRSTEIS